jgi:segregation and condensation protein B
MRFAHIVQLDLIGTQNLLLELQQDLDQRHSGLTIRQVAGGYQLATRPEAFAVVERLSQVVDRKISAPTMETLSIIAFRQPITKAEIEQIRGVRIERALQKLMELELVAEVGRKKVLGRPILYGTTDAFLRCFGINTLEDLPALPTTEDVAAGLDAEQMELFNEVQSAAD